MKSVDMLAFDLDGTLIDSTIDLTDSVNHALSTLGLAEITVEAVKGYVGDGVAATVQRALGGQADKYFPEAIALFRDYYEGHLLDHTALYPDVADLLDYFGDKKKVLVTNKTEKYTLRIVKALRIDDCFLDVCGEDSTPFKKPDPRLLELIMEKRGVVPARTVMIGDGANDILLAKRAGAISCAFLNGISDREKLLSLAPDFVCERLSDLKAFFC
ncbi:MAG: HAD-IA family hydrolase [Syntrophobacterales bacterium]|nr:HAD-IA family hydrolase [Syntrophobacterales bacterium]